MRKSSATPPASRKHPQKEQKASASPQRGPEAAATAPSLEGGGSRPSSPFAALSLRRSRFSSVPLVELKHDTSAEITSPASVELPRRHVTFYSDVDSDSSISGGGFCSMSDTMESFKEVSGSPPQPSVRIKHITRNSDGSSRFPKLDECAHFHYDNVELGPINVVLSEGDDRTDVKGLSDGDWWFCVQVTSNSKSWQVRRSLDNFQMLDRQLHRCVYDRKFSLLQEIDAQSQESEDVLRTMLTQYLERFSHLAGSLINCGPVLNWLELDNRGNRLIVTDEAAINTPAVAAAYVTKRYASQATDEISLEVGDIISVIDMPPPEESSWWRGKKGFQVGFFPCECVEIIGDKVPQSIKVPKTPSKPVLRKHGKLIAFFRSFLLSRPSRRKLKQSGILKERVFGCDLGEHLMNTGRDIPLVLKCCTEFIEQYGIVDGIYRLSGVTSNIQKLRHAFDEDRVPNLLDEAILQDIHCVASLLKMYFRELPNPLLTFHLYDKFVNAVQSDEDLRLLKLRDVVQQLPPPHYRSLEYLMRHLSKVAAHGFQTGMTPKNVAIVWAPNLLRSRDIENGGVGALHVVGVQAVLTEYLIRYTDIIFSEKMPIFPTLIVGEETPKKTRPKSLAISTPTKLLSLEEARSRALTSNLLGEHQKFIDVGGGEETLPIKYHTIIELPTRRRSMGKGKKSPSGWRSFFSRSWHSTSGRRKNRRSERPKIGSPIFSEHSPLVLQTKAVTESEVSHTNTKKLRTVKSAESLFPLNVTSLQIAPNQVFSPVDKFAASHKDPTTGVLSVSSIRKSSCYPTHIRSTSHDSYFERIPEYPGDDELDQGDSIPEDVHSKSSQNLYSCKSDNDPEFRDNSSARELPGSVESTPKRKLAQKQKLVSFDSEASSPKLQKISLKRLYHTLSSPPLIKRKDSNKRIDPSEEQKNTLQSRDSLRKINFFPRNRSEGSMKDEMPQIASQTHRKIKSSVPSIDSTVHTSFETSLDDTSAKDTVSVEVHKTLSDSSAFRDNDNHVIKKYSRCLTEDSVESALLDDSMDTMNFSMEGTISDSVSLSQLLSFDSKNGDCAGKDKQSEFSVYPLESSLMTPESPTGENVSEIPSSEDSEVNDSSMGDMSRQIQTDSFTDEVKKILSNHSNAITNALPKSENKSDNVLVCQTEQLNIKSDRKVENSVASESVHSNLSPNGGDVLNKDLQRESSFVGSIILSPPENFVDDSRSPTAMIKKQKNDSQSKMRSEYKINTKSPGAKPLERSMTEELCPKFVSGIAVSGSFAHELFRASNEFGDAFQKKRSDKMSPTTPIEDSRRKFESEIGRLIVRDRQMKMEMEQIKAERQKYSKQETVPDFEKAKSKVEKKFTDALDFRKSPVRTFECDKKKLDSDDLLKSLKDSVEERKNPEPLFSHGYSCFVRMESKPSVKELLSKFEGQRKESDSFETFKHSGENSSFSPKHASSVFSNVQVINHNFSNTPTKTVNLTNTNQSLKDNQSSHNREHIFQTECVVRFPHPKLSSVIRNECKDSYKNGTLNSFSMSDSVGSNSWTSGQTDHRIKISNSRTNFLSSDNLTSPSLQDSTTMSFSCVRSPHTSPAQTEQSQTQGNLESSCDRKNLCSSNGTQNVKTTSQEFNRPFSTFKDTFDRANRMTYQMKKEFFQRELSQDIECLRSPGAQDCGGDHFSRLVSENRKRHTQTRQRPKSVPPPVCRLSYVSEKLSPSNKSSFQGSQNETIPKQNVPKMPNFGFNGKELPHTSQTLDPPKRIKERAAMFERSLSFSGYADKRPYVPSSHVQKAQSRSSAR